jgi:hypothetical protein
MKMMIRMIIFLHAFIGNGYPIAAIQFDTQSDIRFNQKGFPTFSKINQLIFILLLQRIERTVRIFLQYQAPTSLSSLLLLQTSTHPKYL